MIEERAQDIRHLGARIQEGFWSLAAEFPDQLESARGRGHLAGLKFRRVDDAKAFQKGLFDAGFWTRVHAYHEGHSTVLTKLGFLADETIVDFVVGRFRDLLKSPALCRAWSGVGISANRASELTWSGELQS
jgi:acetylornithine/succinyldiaminopimelate/putrescine aminotransferase